MVNAHSVLVVSEEVHVDEITEGLSVGTLVGEVPRCLIASY